MRQRGLLENRDGRIYPLDPDVSGRPVHPRGPRGGVASQKVRQHDVAGAADRGGKFQVVTVPSVKEGMQRLKRRWYDAVVVGAGPRGVDVSRLQSVLVEQYPDAALAMFDKMLGSVFRRADRAYKDNVVDRAKTLDASARDASTSGNRLATSAASRRRRRRPLRGSPIGIPLRACPIRPPKGNFPSTSRSLGRRQELK